MTALSKGFYTSYSESKNLSFRLKRVCPKGLVHCPDPTFADLVQWKFCMVNIRALLLWGGSERKSKNAGGGNLDMNSNNSVYN